MGRAGFFAANPLFAPNIIFAFLILFGVLRKVLASRPVQNFIKKTSVPWLTVIQTYRVVGVSFFVLYNQGVLPAVFAFPSGLGDVFIGATAPIVALIYLLKKSYSKKLAIIWNIIGIADLVIAVSIGILAFPRPVQFLPTIISTEPLSLYPLVVIPLFAVPLAIVIHMISLKKVAFAP